MCPDNEKQLIGQSILHWFVFSGKKFPEATAAKVDDIWSRIYTRRNIEYQKKCEEIEASEDENATFPSYPLKILPEATGICVMRGFCHHREYKTHDTSTGKLVDLIHS